MKRLPDSSHLYHSVDEARIFRDDLDEILDLLRQSGLREEIVSGQYSFESIDELHSHAGSRPTRISIRGYREDQRWHAVEIEIDGRSLTLSGDSNLLGASGYRLRDHVLNLRFNPWYLRVWAWWLIGIAFTVVDVAVPKGDAPWRIVLGWTPMTCYGIAVGTLLVRRQFGGVRLSRRHEGGFFKRNSNAIGLLIVGATLGAIVTRIVALLTSK